MFKKKTLFIVGAGASHEFGLPVGTGLAKIISDKTVVAADRGFNDRRVGDMDLYSEFKKDRPRINEFLTASQVIHHGVQLASSIDDFLDIHSTNAALQQVGKLAICKSILERERDSVLYFDRSNTYNRIRINKFENTWLLKFVRMLGRGVAKENIESIFDNVAFIVFNYDRCIEHGLYHCLQQLFSIDSNRAKALLDKLTILHPYGRVGALKTDDSRNGVAFGGNIDRLNEDYWQLASSIKTYTERISDESELEQLRNQLEISERLVFLGFAFHDQNMELLRPLNQLPPKEVFATAFGMADSDVEVIQAQLLTFFQFPERNDRRKKVEIRNDITCSELFDQYSRSLPA